MQRNDGLFITRKEISEILAMKLTTLDAFIARTEDFPPKISRGKYSRKSFNEWCTKHGLQ